MRKIIRKIFSDFWQAELLLPRCVVAGFMGVFFVYNLYLLVIFGCIGYFFFQSAGFLLPQAWMMICAFSWVCLTVFLAGWGFVNTCQPAFLKTKKTGILILLAAGLSFCNFALLHPSVREWGSGESTHKVGF